MNKMKAIRSLEKFKTNSEIPLMKYLLKRELRILGMFHLRKDKTNSETLILTHGKRVSFKSSKAYHKKTQCQWKYLKNPTSYPLSKNGLKD